SPVLFGAAPDNGKTANGASRASPKRVNFIVLSFVVFVAGGPLPTDCGVKPTQAIVASSVRWSPWLSTQLTAILSPALPPLKLNCTNGFLETAVPHWALMTVLPLWVALIFWI